MDNNYNNQNYNGNMQGYPPYNTNGNNNFYQAPKQTNGMAIASLVLGIISIPISCFWGIGIVPGILALILGLVSKPKTGTGTDKLSGVAIGGIVCGAIGCVSSVFWFILEVFILVNDPAFKYLF